MHHNILVTYVFGSLTPHHPFLKQEHVITSFSTCDNKARHAFMKCSITFLRHVVINEDVCLFINDNKKTKSDLPDKTAMSNNTIESILLSKGVKP